MNLVQACLLNNGKMLELWTSRLSSKQLTPLIRHFSLFFPNSLAFSLSALEFSLSMTFDLFWEQTLYFLAFLIWKPDDLFTGPREEGKQPFVNNCTWLFIFGARALEMVWAAYKTGFQWITASEDHPSLSPVSTSGPPPTAHQKLNCHLCFIEKNILKCVMKKAVGQSYGK